MFSFLVCLLLSKKWKVPNVWKNLLKETFCFATGFAQTSVLCTFVPHPFTWIYIKDYYRNYHKNKKNYHKNYHKNCKNYKNYQKNCKNYHKNCKNCKNYHKIYKNQLLLPHHLTENQYYIISTHCREEGCIGLFNEECSSLTTKRFPNAQEISLQTAAIALNLSGQCTSTITLLQLEGRSPFQFEDDCNCSWGVKQMCGAQKWCNLKMHVFTQRGLVPMHKSADRLLKEENMCKFNVNVCTERRILRSWNQKSLTYANNMNGCI